MLFESNKQENYPYDDESFLKNEELSEEKEGDKDDYPIKKIISIKQNGIVFYTSNFFRFGTILDMNLQLEAMSLDDSDELSNQIQLEGIVAGCRSIPYEDETYEITLIFQSMNNDEREKLYELQSYLADVTNKYQGESQSNYPWERFSPLPQNPILGLN